MLHDPFVSKFVPAESGRPDWGRSGLGPDSFVGSGTQPTCSPLHVTPIRNLGHGRAAIAQLVDTTFGDGRTIRCVEKVFAPGRLTRSIYGAAFWAPFAYATNEDAILACFYRRRVAAAILKASGQPVEVAMPLYVRYDAPRRAWVLAAEHVQGRGIIPATSRFEKTSASSPAEIETLVNLMRTCSKTLVDAGLIGSGWQIDPRAMVSTANLLRTGDRYTIVDLESGIPAVLVPHYILRGLKHGSLVPFDDCDPGRLRSWCMENQFALRGRLSAAELEILPADIDALIEHAEGWKSSEIAPLRRPWELITTDRMHRYRESCRKRWIREGLLSESAAASATRQRLTWWATRIPGRSGRALAKFLTDSTRRSDLRQFCTSTAFRSECLVRSSEKTHQRLVEEHRIAPKTEKSRRAIFVHRLLATVLPARWHRSISDSSRRRDNLRRAVLLALSRRYQCHLGRRQIHRSISRWRDQSRITDAQAIRLRDEADGASVRAYARGFGSHLAVKTLTPVIAPAKVGGFAMFLSTGNLWFLAPVALLPLVRTAITLMSMLSSRHEGTRHAEALLVGMLPTVGSLAYPIQMHSAQPELSAFLIRDAASRAACRIPIYGGGDSRTEMMVISASDFLVASFAVVSSVLARTLKAIPTPWKRRQSLPSPQAILYRMPRTRWGRRLDEFALREIARESDRSESLNSSAGNDPVIVALKTA